MSSGFLRRYITTRNFSLGEPRNFTVAGGQLFFLRGKDAGSKAQCLFRAEVKEGGVVEELLIDPSDGEANVPVAERRRRERLRETAGGIVAYSVDAAGQTIAYTFAGCIWIARSAAAFAPQKIAATQGAFDPRLSSDGSHVAFVANNSLQVCDVETGAIRQLAAADNPEVTWGMAEFVAAEEIGRQRGFWWSPDGHSILAAKVDSSPVRQWYISDPTQPGEAPQPTRYPAAGTPNTKVGLAILPLHGDTPPVAVQWDAAQFEYLVDVHWDETSLLLTVQSRDQKTLQIHKVEPSTGRTELLRQVENKHWVELLPGAPGLLGTELFFIQEDDQGRRIVVGNRPATPESLYIRACHGQASGRLVFSAYAGDPKAWEVWALGADGDLQKIQEAGVHAVTAGEETVVIKSLAPDQPTSEVTVWQWQAGQLKCAGTITSQAETAPLRPVPRFFKIGRGGIQSALLLPRQYDGQARLPVLLRPYGGPHGQQVLAANKAYLLDQWYAEQGFAVVVTDGRGTPGHSPAWEKALAGDLIGPVLEDQIEALQDIAAHDDRLDLGNVGIAGWSFGGYLSAFAVVRHPEVFKAAVAGAPVTDWRLYDTHYTERYMGDPAKNQAAYDNTSLIEQAAQLQRPLMIIHGLADDNVAVANSLQLSAALWEAGRHHELVLIPGATHMVSSPDSAENIENIQLQFFRRHLG